MSMVFPLAADGTMCLPIRSPVCIPQAQTKQLVQLKKYMPLHIPHQSALHRFIIIHPRNPNCVLFLNLFLYISLYSGFTLPPLPRLARRLNNFSPPSGASELRTDRCLDSTYAHFSLRRCPCSSNYVSAVFQVQLHHWSLTQPIKSWVHNLDIKEVRAGVPLQENLPTVLLFGMKLVSSWKPNWVRVHFFTNLPNRRQALSTSPNLKAHVHKCVLRLTPTLSAVTLVLNIVFLNPWRGILPLLVLVIFR